MNHNPSKPSTLTKPSTPSDTNTVIKVSNVGKKFCKSLFKSMLYGADDITKTTFGIDPHPEKIRPDEFWALDDVSFELKRGEALGIIGPNGSGKTTLLRLLNGIFMPDKGKIEINGKVGALIELGAGFHSMLTGRENIYINGAVLGMSKKEIDEKFDSIIEFADIGDFLDTPVRNYSSGMYVRLGFAIAIHSEPDILLIDEILAVGDINFRIKCVKFMRKYIENKSIILVSHFSNDVIALCKETILVSQGKVIKKGKTEDVMGYYEDIVHNQTIDISNKEIIEKKSQLIEIGKIELFDEQGIKKDTFKMGESILAKIPYTAYQNIKNPVFTVWIIRDIDGVQCGTTTTALDSISIRNIEGKGAIEVKIELPYLIPGTYRIGASVWDTQKKLIEYAWRALEKFYIVSDLSGVSRDYGFFVLKAKWKILK